MMKNTFRWEILYALPNTKDTGKGQDFFTYDNNIDNDNDNDSDNDNDNDNDNDSDSDNDNDNDKDNIIIYER